MKDQTRQNMTSADIWTRILYMVVFAIIFGFSKLITIFLVLFQLVSILVSGKANEPLLKFGKNMSVYFYEILEFQTFNSEIRPFPFTPWPDEEPGGECWIVDPDYDLDDVGIDDEVDLTYKENLDDEVDLADKKDRTDKEDDATGKDDKADDKA
jgi:hypothetical protein